MLFFHLARPPAEDLALACLEALPHVVRARSENLVAPSTECFCVWYAALCAMMLVVLCSLEQLKILGAVVALLFVEMMYYFSWAGDDAVRLPVHHMMFVGVSPSILHAGVFDWGND